MSAPGAQIGSCTAACQPAGLCWAVTVHADQCRRAGLSHDPAELDGLAGGTALVRRAVAGNPHTAPTTLVRLADNSAGTRYQISQNPACPPELLRRWVADGSAKVRQRVAANPGTPGDILGRLARDDDPQVQQAALANPGLPPDVASRYVHSTDAELRKFVAANPALSGSCQETLAGDQVPTVRTWLARNPCIAGELLDRMEPVAHGALRTAIVGNRNCPAEVQRRVLQQHPALDHLFSMVRNRQTSPQLVEQICQHPAATPQVRLKAATATWCAPAQLTILAGDPDTKVRTAVAAHGGCPRETLERLLCDQVPRVRQAAAANPALPRHIRAMWQLAQA
jgi:hypothetical protein